MESAQPRKRNETNTKMLTRQTNYFHLTAFINRKMFGSNNSGFIFGIHFSFNNFWDDFFFSTSKFK